jgi:phage major head subunit gpT-like protein
MRNELGRRDLEELQEVGYAIVHRYTSEGFEGDKADVESDNLVRNVIACLRLVRPMRQHTSLIRGVLQADGKVDVQHF